MPPLLFTLGGPHLNFGSGQRRGVPPSLCGVFPLPAVRLLISGITRDSTGAVLANCAVALYRTSDDAFLERVTSDANGAFTFQWAGLAQTYYIVAYKDLATDVRGTSDNTLVGIA